MTRKSQAVLEAHAKALGVEVRKLKRELKAAVKRGDDLEALSMKQHIHEHQLLSEIERKDEILLEKGVFPLPEHAIRAMDTKYDTQPGVRADRFMKVGI